MNDQDRILLDAPGEGPMASGFSPLGQPAGRLLEFGKRQRADFENSPRPMRIFDPVTLRYLAVNDAAVRLYGYSRAEFAGLTLRDTRHRDEHADQLASLGQRDGYLMHYGPLRHVRKSGEAFMVEVVSQDVLFEGRWARVSLTLDLTERAHALALARQREREFEALAEHLPDLVARFDRNHRYVYVNSAVERLTGVPREALLGRTQRELGMPEAIVTLFEHSLSDTVRTGESHLLEFAYSGRSGERLFEAYHVPERDAAGEVRTVLCVARDITERKKAEDEARQQKDLFAAVIDNLPMGVFIRDAQTLRYVLRNRFCEGANGYCVPSSVGLTAHDLFPKKQADFSVATDRQALDSGRMVETVEQEMLGRSGEPRVFHVRKVPLYGDDGKPWMVVGIADDITERRRAERTLRESETRLELAVESTGLGMWDWNMRTGEVWRHPRWARILGYEPGEVAPHICMWREFCHPADYPQSQEHLLAHFEGKTPSYRADYRMRNKRGSWIWIGCRGMVIEREEDGTPRRMIGYVRDISDRKTMEEALRESQEQFRAVTETANEAIVSADGEGRIIYLNQSAIRLFGHSVEEAIGEPLTRLMPARFRAAHTRGLRRMREGHPSSLAGKMVELSGQRKDGSEFPLELSLSSWTTGAGVFFTGIMRDITRRKRAENALRESEERFRQLAENIREVFWINTRAGDKLAYVSPAYEEIWGRTCESLYRDPRGWMEAIHAEDLPPLEAFHKTMASGQPTDTEYRIIRPDGSVRWIRDRSYPMQQGNGMPLVCGIAEDITSRKRGEEERITHAFHQRDALVREVHHRIKNHLQGIAGLLRNKAGNDPEAARRMEAAIAQLQSVAVVYGLQSELAESGVPLRRMLEAICASAEDLSTARVARRFPAAGGRVRLAETEAVPVAVALNELVFNAIEHGRRRAGSTSIEIALKESGNGAEIRIVNRGKLPPRFDYARGIGTGTGLDLVRTLLGPAGSVLEYAARDGKVEVTLSLKEPLLTARKRAARKRVAA